MHILHYVSALVNCNVVARSGYAFDTPTDVLCQPIWERKNRNVNVGSRKRRERRKSPF